MASYTYTTSADEDAAITAKVAQQNAILQAQGLPSVTAQAFVLAQFKGVLAPLITENAVAVAKQALMASKDLTSDQKKALGF